MKKYLPIFSILVLALFGFKGDTQLASKLGKSVQDFRLQNIDGRFVALKDYQHAKGIMVVFTCNHCPFAKLYTNRYNQLNSKYSQLGVPLIAINAMDTLLYDEESFALMQQKAKTEKFNFPYLYDATQAVGKDFGANHTPHAYIIWQENKQWIVKYSGGIDDNGDHPEKAKPFIANAVNTLLQGKKIANPETQSFGCKIFYRKSK